MIPDCGCYAVRLNAGGKKMPARITVTLNANGEFEMWLNPEPRRGIIPHLSRYGLLISLAAVSLASSIVGARTDNSRPLPSPSASPTTVQTTIDQCRQQYSALGEDVERKSRPIRDARDVSHGRMPANTICKLFTALGEAETRMIDFVEANSN